MTYKEIISSVIGKFQSMITENSTVDEIDELQGLINEVQSLEPMFEEMDVERSKLKDKIIHMVRTQGSDETPVNASTGSKPMTIEECLAIVQSKKEA